MYLSEHNAEQAFPFESKIVYESDDYENGMFLV